MRKKNDLLALIALDFSTTTSEAKEKMGKVSKPACIAASILIASYMLWSVPVDAQWQERPNNWARISDSLRVGDPAFDFRLRTKDGRKEVQLSSFRGRSPVVLVFGSYT